MPAPRPAGMRSCRLLGLLCVLAALGRACGSRGMCTYITLDRAGGRWRIPAHCTHLYLTQVQFGAVGARQMGAALSANPGVTAVDASSCGIQGLSGAAALGDSLRHNTVVQRLNLGNNRMGDSGAEALAEGLAVNTGLRSLSLAHNRIGPRGAAALARALRANRALTSLDLDLNRLHDEGAREIAEALRENDSLTSLVLSGNQIGNVGAVALAEALAVNRGLTRLHLKYNRISGEGARLLAEAALDNGRVTLTGPEFLLHTMQRVQMKRLAYAAPLNATRLLEVAAVYDEGRLSAHKISDRYAQAYCWYRLASEQGDAGATAAARKQMEALTSLSPSHWPLGRLFGPRCDAACVALAHEICTAPHVLTEAVGPIVTYGERKKRWLRREVGGAHHAKDEL